jgi:hypothetical protein
VELNSYSIYIARLLFEQVRGREERLKLPKSTQAHDPLSCKMVPTGYDFVYIDCRAFSARRLKQLFMFGLRSGPQETRTCTRSRLPV